MGNSKIVYYGETLIDITGDTVEAAKLLKGVTAHDKKGEKITGTFEAADPYAFIIANYPEGSTVSCTNSSGEKNLSTTQKLFYIKKGATSCVVTATLGSQSTSATVTGIAEGSSKTITLSYELKIYDHGTEGVTLATSSGGGGEVAKESEDIKLYTYAEYGWITSSAVYTEDTVDVTPYTKLTVTATRSGSHSTAAKVRNGDTDVASVAITNTSTKANFEIDVSSLSGNYTIGIYSSGGHGSGGSSSSETTVYAIILS